MARLSRGPETCCYRKLYHRCLPGLDIQIDILNNIVFTSRMQSFKAGIDIIPHSVFTEQFGYLETGQSFCGFILFGAIN